MSTAALIGAAVARASIYVANIYIANGRAFSVSFRNP